VEIVRRGSWGSSGDGVARDSLFSLHASQDSLELTVEDTEETQPLDALLTGREEPEQEPAAMSNRDTVLGK
jgi:hypothetical protein